MKLEKKYLIDSDSAIEHFELKDEISYDVPVIQAHNFNDFLRLKTVKAEAWYDLCTCLFYYNCITVKTIFTLIIKINFQKTKS